MAWGPLGTKMEPLVYPLSQAPKTVATTIRVLGHKPETRQHLRKSASTPRGELRLHNTRQGLARVE